MTFLAKLQTTLTLTRYCLFPPPAARCKTQDKLLIDTRPLTISRKELAYLLADLEAHANPEGSLHLLFIGACFPAAPFLLYRLKRWGYSTCRATVTPTGLLLSARR